MIETVDHDQGPQPVYCAPRGFLMPVMIDNRRWIIAPFGDPVAQHLLGMEPEVPHAMAP